MLHAIHGSRGRLTRLGLAIAVACGVAGLRCASPTDQGGDAGPDGSAVEGIRPEPCTTDRDCRGVLPTLCMAGCEAGSGCAHWTCIEEECVMRFCD